MQCILGRYIAYKLLIKINKTKNQASLCFLMYHALNVSMHTVLAPCTEEAFDMLNGSEWCW